MGIPFVILFFYMNKTFPSYSFLPKYHSHITNWHGHIPFSADLISLTQPNLIVELGTHYGDSYFSFCQACDSFSNETRLFAIDHWEGDSYSGYYGSSVYKEIYNYNKLHYNHRSKLIRDTFDNSVSQFADKSIDILHIDGSHDYSSVMNDFSNWLPKVSKGGVILFHDTQILERNFGVHKFWSEIASSYPHMEFTPSCGLGVLINTEKLLSTDVLFPLFQSTSFQSIKEYYEECADRITRHIESTPSIPIDNFKT
jgi:O-antigen biosynthesis protein